MSWVDRHRLFPRAALICYFVGCGLALDWYFDYEVKYETRCDAQTIQVLVSAGSSVEDATLRACPIVGAVGHPTGYTALMSTLVGAGAAIFGLYVNSGPARKDP